MRPVRSERNLAFCRRPLRLELLEPRHLLAAQVVISEFQAINQSTLEDSDREFTDWLELHNASADSVNLTGWYLTDDPTDLTKWPLPALELATHERRIVFASGKNCTDPVDELHTNFDLADDAGFLALVRPDGETISQQFGPDYPAQWPDQSYGLSVVSETLGESEHFFLVPTPGSENHLPAAAPPKILGESGIHFTETMVQLATESQHLEIRYTLDGSAPTEESQLYTAPIRLTESAMLQARTFDTSPRPQFTSSNPASGTYFILDEELRNRSSDLPIVIIDTLQQSFPAATSPKLRPVNVLVLDVDETTGRATIENGRVDYFGRGGVRDDGTDDCCRPKPNILLETWGLTGTNQSDGVAAPILGIDADSQWYFEPGNNFDTTLLHNQFAIDLSSQIGQWAPDYSIFDSTDLVDVLRFGEYEDRFGGNSTWQEGDWNGDGDFDSSDLVLAFRSGGYVLAATALKDG